MALSSAASAANGLPVWQPWFVAQVRARARWHGVAGAPEVRDLIGHPPAHLTHRQAEEHYAMLSPSRYVAARSPVLIVHDMRYGWRLRPWTIAARYLGSRATAGITRIVVDRTGTHLHDESGAERICYEAGNCNPRALVQDSGPLKEAAGILARYTGQSVSWEDLTDRDSVTAARADGAWSISSS
jgi:hypothetical protein